MKPEYRLTTVNGRELLVNSVAHRLRKRTSSFCCKRVAAGYTLYGKVDGKHLLYFIQFSGYPLQWGMGVKPPSGAVAYVSENGNYWASGAYSASNGRNLNFNSGNVNPQNWNNRSYGNVVRPSSEITHGGEYWLI